MYSPNLYTCTSPHLAHKCTIFTYTFCNELERFVTVYNMRWAADIWKKLADMLPHNHPTALRAVAQGLSARLFASHEKTKSSCCFNFRQKVSLQKETLGSDSADRCLAVVTLLPFPSPPQLQWRVRCCTVQAMVMYKQIVLADLAEMSSFLPVAISLLFADLFHAELPPHMETWVATWKILVLVYSMHLR